MRICNTGIVAHVDAGKTTITEQLLCKSGAIEKPGSVDKGTAKTDYMDIEQRRGISVRAAAVQLVWENTRIHLIDTPGHADFSADVERALRVLDCAVLVVSAAEGVQARTQLLFRALMQRRLPTIVFINKTDRVGADIDRTMAQLREKLSPQMVLIGGQSDRALGEALADRDEELFERVLAGETIERARLDRLIAQQCQRLELFRFSAAARCTARAWKNCSAPWCGIFPPARGARIVPFRRWFINWSTTPNWGRWRMCACMGEGRRARQPVQQPHRAAGKVTQLFTASGAALRRTDSAVCGEVAVLCGQAHARIGDVLGDPQPIPPAGTPTRPLLSVRVLPKTPEQTPALLAALEELTSEDPMLDVRWEPSLREMLLSITGLIQLEVLGELLKTRFGLEADFDQPTVVYMETPAQSGTGFVAYTMPKPCWAVIELAFEPLERGSGVVFESVVNPNQMLPRYQEHIRQCLPRALRQGPLGWQVTDVKITLTGGHHHQFHPHPLDFFVATPMAVMDGLTRTGPTLLEPYMRFEAHVPEKCGPQIIARCLRMRGQVDEFASGCGRDRACAAWCAGNLADFPVYLASDGLRQGTLFEQFDSYRPARWSWAVKRPIAACIRWIPRGTFWRQEARFPTSGRRTNNLSDGTRSLAACAHAFAEKRRGVCR
jgi:ribosomal protection tetracycline resistance protein